MHIMPLRRQHVLLRRLYSKFTITIRTLARTHAHTHKNWRNAYHGTSWGCHELKRCAQMLLYLLWYMNFILFHFLPFCVSLSSCHSHSQRIQWYSDDILLLLLFCHWIFYINYILRKLHIVYVCDVVWRQVRFHATSDLWTGKFITLSGFTIWCLEFKWIYWYAQIMNWLSRSLSVVPPTRQSSLQQQQPQPHLKHSHFSYGKSMDYESAYKLHAQLPCGAVIRP